MTNESELRCPSCGSNRVTVTEETKWMVNTMEHWCHSVKAHDADATADCLACRWQGIRAQLTAAPQAPAAALDAGVVRDAVLAERERLIQLVIGRAQSHNGPHLLTLELNQLAAWMAGKDWHGVPPPEAAMSAQAGGAA